MTHRDESNSRHGGFQKNKFVVVSHPPRPPPTPLTLAELISVASLRGLDLMLRLPSYTGRAAERVLEHANRDADEEC